MESFFTNDKELPCARRFCRRCSLLLIVRPGLFCSAGRHDGESIAAVPNCLGLQGKRPLVCAFVLVTSGNEGSLFYCLVWRICNSQSRSTSSNGTVRRFFFFFEVGLFFIAFISFSTMPVMVFFEYSLVVFSFFFPFSYFSILTAHRPRQITIHVTTHRQYSGEYVGMYTLFPEDESISAHISWAYILTEAAGQGQYQGRYWRGRGRDLNCRSARCLLSDAWKWNFKTKETAARIVLEDDIFRAMTHQVQYMAIHCTLKWKNSIYVQTLDKTCTLRMTLKFSASTNENQRERLRPNCTNQT